MRDKFKGYDMREWVDGLLHMLPRIKVGTERYNKLIKDLEEYQGFSKDIMKDCPTVFPNLSELILSSLILYHMVCNEIYGTEEVTEEEKEVATTIMYRALEKFDVII